MDLAAKHGGLVTNRRQCSAATMVATSTPIIGSNLNSVHFGITTLQGNHLHANRISLMTQLFCSVFGWFGCNVPCTAPYGPSIYAVVKADQTLTDPTNSYLWGIGTLA